MKKYYFSAFDEWLRRPLPQWKINLDNCHPQVFHDLKIRRERVEKILEVLDEHGVFKNMK